MFSASISRKQPIRQPSVSGSKTQALPKVVRTRMESLFDSCLEEVKIHVGRRAASMGCRAYAQGNTIHFAPGQYQPDSTEGLFLLGHELAHVVQQRSGRVIHPTGVGTVLVHDPRLEAEADLFGAAAAGVASAPDLAVQSGGQGKAPGDLTYGSVVQAKFANAGAVAAPGWNHGWESKKSYEINAPAWNDVMDHASNNTLSVFVLKGDIAVPIIAGGPGPNDAYFGLFSGGRFSGYVDQSGEAVLSEQSQVGQGGTFNNIPSKHRDIVDWLIDNFSVTSITEKEAKTTKDYVLTYQSNTNRIDRQNPSRNNTHAKFAVQIGSATYAGIEMEVGRNFSVNHVRAAFTQSIQDGTYRRVFFG